MEETIGNRLKRLRKQLGNISQGEFAKMIELKQGTYCDIENGKEVLTPRNMKLICFVFGVNPAWLENGDLPLFSRSEELSPEKKELLDLYDRLIPENRKEIQNYINEKLELQEFRKKNGL